MTDDTITPDLPDRIENTSGSLVFSADGEFVFYTAVDANHRPSKVFRHRIGTPIESDVLAYEELVTKLLKHRLRYVYMSLHGGTPRVHNSLVRADTFGYLQRSFLGCVSDVDQQEARAVGEQAVAFAFAPGSVGGSVCG